MGWFDDIKKGFSSMVGGVDEQLLATGLLGRGGVLSVAPGGATVQLGNGLVERVCTFTVEVMLDGEPPYQATCTQRVGEIYLPQLASGQAVVSVRVDPADRSRIALDFATPVPEVRMAEKSGPGSAADILANGRPVVVVLVGSAPIGVKSSRGDDVHALTVTLAEGVETPYQVQVGNAVPASALPLLYPGSRLHAKLGAGPNDVVVDWAAGPA